ncbi:MAG: Gfo/Idh/MocA family protein [Bryobacteraceae bacterium]
MISEYHLRGWLRIPEVEIVALGNRTLARAEQRRREFVPSARTYSDLAEMLDAERPDFVDILTAPAVHREHCRIARERGVHIICQKPLTDSLGDAQALAAEMAGYPMLFAVHENHRYRPWFRIIRERMQQGFFGKVHMVRLEHLSAGEPGEAYKNEADLGVLWEHGTHLVDMMRCLLGEPLRVYARMHRLNPRVRGESLVHALYEYPEVTAIVAVAWKPAAITQASALVAGGEGKAYWEGTITRGQQRRLRLSRGSQVILDEARSPMDEYVESFYLLERECTDFMLGRRNCVQQTVEEHLRTLTCAWAAYESARRRDWVSIDSM